MAIKFDVNNKELCKRLYLNYHCYENTLNVTAPQMGMIINRWSEEERESWQAEAPDSVTYDFNDEAFEGYVNEGYDNTKEEYGDDVNTTGEKRRNIGESIATGTGGAAGISSALGGISSCEQLSRLFPKLSKITGKLNNKIKGLAVVSYILGLVSCVTSFVIGRAAKNNPANKEEIEAVNQIFSEMENQQNILNDSVKTMEDKENEIIDTSLKAQTINETAQTQINQTKATTSRDEIHLSNLKAKEASGKELTAGDKSMMATLEAKVKNQDSVITSTVTSASGEVDGLSAIIESMQTDYDLIAENIGNVQGFTEYAQEIDEVTQKNCEKQAQIQTWNNINGYAAAVGMAAATAALAAKAFTLPFVGIALGVIVIGVGVTAAVLAVKGAQNSKNAAQQQTQFAQEAGMEIAARKTTQDMETETLTQFEEQDEAYDETLRTMDGYNKFIIPEETNLNIN